MCCAKAHVLIVQCEPFCERWTRCVVIPLKSLQGWFFKGLSTVLLWQVDMWEEYINCSNFTESVSMDRCKQICNLPNTCKGRLWELCEVSRYVGRGIHCWGSNPCSSWSWPSFLSTNADKFSNKSNTNAWYLSYTLEAMWSPIDERKPMTERIGCWLLLNRLSLGSNR